MDVLKGSMGFGVSIPLNFLLPTKLKHMVVSQRDMSINSIHFASSLRLTIQASLVNVAMEATVKFPSPCHSQTREAGSGCFISPVGM